MNSETPGLSVLRSLFGRRRLQLADGDAAAKDDFRIVFNPHARLYAQCADTRSLRSTQGCSRLHLTTAIA